MRHPVSTKLIFLSLDQNDNKPQKCLEKEGEKRPQKCADFHDIEKGGNLGVPQITSFV